MCIYIESTSRPSYSCAEGHLGLHPLGAELCPLVFQPSIHTGQAALQLGEPRRSQGSESERSYQKNFWQRDWLL